MMIDHLNRQFQYDRWSNDKVLKAIEMHGESNSQALKIFCHILAAQQIWYTRLTGGYSGHLAVWPTFTLPECYELKDEFYRNWRSYIHDLTEERLSEQVPYHNSKGQAFESAIIDVLNHVVLHGMHHRGQIALLLRQSQKQPAITDFIYYTRNPKSV